MSTKEPTWRLPAFAIVSIISLGAGFGLSYGNLVTDGELGAELAPVRTNVATLQNKWERGDEINKHILEMLKDLKAELKRANDQIEEVQKAQFTTLHEVIETRKATSGNYQPPAATPNPLSR